MTKLNVYHLFRTALVSIGSRPRKTGELAYQSLVLKKKEIDRQNFFGFVHMSPNRFGHLLEVINPIILKMNTVRAPIPPDERLAIALRFLSSGERRTALNYYFKIEIASACGIIEEVCQAIWKHTLKAVPTN